MTRVRRKGVEVEKIVQEIPYFEYKVGAYESSFAPSASCTLDAPSDATAFVAIILAFLGLSDFTAASIRDELALSYWSSQLPVRLFFLFFVTGYTYLFKRGPETFGEAIKHTSGPADGLKNSLVFTWGFMEVTTWFWIYTSMRDEIRQLSNRQAEKDRDKNA
ncbi:MAG: hypothetical protein Q9157_008187 [Trypethelium eluteriae]